VQFLAVAPRQDSESLQLTRHVLLLSQRFLLTHRPPDRATEKQKITRYSSWSATAREWIERCETMLADLESGTVN
jgi:hypothetical protein